VKCLDDHTYFSCLFARVMYACVTLAFHVHSAVSVLFQGTMFSYGAR
jgi:hypothetical protein